MGTIVRGIKNAFRNNIRTLSVILILSISIAMSLIMFISLKTVQGKISNVKNSVGNSISISPAGMRGFEGGGTLLTNQNAQDVKTISGVKSVISSLNGRLQTEGSNSSSGFGRDDTDTNSKTSLTSPPMQAPEGTPDSSRKFMVNGQQVSRNFSMPITVTGVNDLSNLSVLNASSFSLMSGELIEGNSYEKVALLGKDLANQNNLSAGETFTAYSQTITVAGIFDAGNTFANSRVIMPIGSLQTLSDQTDQISSITVITDSIDSLSSVQTEIKNKLGSSVDVTTSEQSVESVLTPLENIKTISLYSLIGSLIAGAIIIFLTMVMIVRERRREIGVLKAIGASNILIVNQFSVESLTMTLISSAFGIILGTFLSNPILKVLINNSQNSGQVAIQNFERGQGGGPGAVMGRMAGNIGNGAVEAVKNLQASVDWNVILYGLGTAILIAILGSALPAYFISKVRPAEVLRSE